MRSTNKALAVLYITVAVAGFTLAFYGVSQGRSCDQEGWDLALFGLGLVFIDQIGLLVFIFTMMLLDHRNK